MAGQGTGAPPSPLGEGPARPTRRGASRTQLKAYAEAIAMWGARFDTAEIAARLGLAEHVVARWVANFRDVVMAETA